MMMTPHSVRLDQYRLRLTRNGFFGHDAKSIVCVALAAALLVWPELQFVGWLEHDLFDVVIDLHVHEFDALECAFFLDDVNPGTTNELTLDLGRSNFRNVCHKMWEGREGFSFRGIKGDSKLNPEKRMRFCRIR